MKKLIVFPVLLLTYVATAQIEHVNEEITFPVDDYNYDVEWALSGNVNISSKNVVNYKLQTVHINWKWWSDIYVTSKFTGEVIKITEFWFESGKSTFDENGVTTSVSYRQMIKSKGDQVLGDLHLIIFHNGMLGPDGYMIWDEPDIKLEKY